MTTANKVTILRILLIPLFITQVIYYLKNGNEWHRFLGLLSFLIASILDGVDGYIARRYNQRSELGAILDPAADKLLLVSAVILLSFTGQTNLAVIPLWMTATILSRDIILLLGWLLVHYICGKVTVRPRVLGKVATVLQMITVVWILLKWPDHWIPYWTIAATVCTGVSGLFYIWDGMRQLSTSPRSSATPQQ